MSKQVDTSKLHQTFCYDSNSGVLTRKASGDVTGWIDGRGYRVVSVKSVSMYAHRVAWAMHFGEWPLQFIDHINGDKSDNRIENLRDVSLAENTQNRNTPIATNTSGLLGVCWDKFHGKWSAVITVDQKQKSLGRFSDKHAAHAAYLKAKSALHKGFVGV